MIYQYIAAAVISVGLTIGLSRMYVAGRREDKRRALLASEDRRKLEEADAIWAQQFGL